MNKLDPQERRESAREAASKGCYEFALKEYVWFHNNALKLKPALAGVRLSFALAEWIDLGKLYPPAITVLIKIRDRKVARILDGALKYNLFHDVSSINSYLKQDEQTHLLFQKLDKLVPEFARDCFRLASDALVKARDFQLAARYLPDPEGIVLRLSEQLNEDIAWADSRKKYKAVTRKAFIRNYCDDVSTVSQILVGSNRKLFAEYFQEWSVALIDDRAARNSVFLRLSKVSGLLC